MPGLTPAEPIAELLADILHLWSSKRIFGVAGDSLSGVTEVLCHDAVDWAHFRHG